MKYIKLFEYFDDDDYRCPECGSDETITREEWEKEDHSGDSIFSEETWDCGKCYQTPDI